MQRFDPIEIVSGLLILGAGAAFFFVSTRYPMGTMSQMGPGFVPHWLGAIAMGLGVIILTGAIRVPSVIPVIAWRAVATILGSIAVFAFLLPRVGLVAATFISCGVAMLGNPDANLRMIAVTSTVIALICWLLFIVTLGLPIPAFWTDL